MNTRKSLAKVFGPVLLLTATLALPMDTALAAPGHRADQHEQNNKDKKDKRQKQETRVRQQRVQQRQQVVKQQKKVVQRQQKVVQQRRVVVQQKKVVQQQALQRQEARRLQTVRQQQALQRQQQLTLQRQQQALERERALARQRQARVYRDNRRYDDRYYAMPRRGGGGADPNVFHVDGVLDDGGECLFLRDHEGRTWAVVGNAYGLQPGEHVRLYGRPVDGGACGYRGAAFDIYEVRTVWADNNHKRTHYDHLYDGPFDQNRAYEDDRYYNGQYDPYEDRSERDSWWDRLFGG